MARFNIPESILKLETSPAVPVFYHNDIDVAKQILTACYAGGMRVFEFTNRGDNAPEVFSQLYPFVRANCPEMALGIGTIYNASQAETFIQLGADFIVQPVTTKEVAKACKKYKTLWIPGALTPNEIHQATLLGAEVIKIFPGSAVTPDYIKAVKGPMPNIKIMVTGGVEPTTESIKKWLDAGAIAVGLGSQLFPPHLIKEQKWTDLTQSIKTLTLYIASRKSNI